MWGVIAFSFGMTATPGPNNTIVFSSGLNHGFLPTMPYMLGTTTGLPLMIVAVAWGLGEFFESFPQAYLCLRNAGAAYILYLAWKIATTPLPSNPLPLRDSDKEDEKRGGKAKKSSGESTRRPTFWNGILFQWMNPKAWILAITGSATYIGTDLPPAKLTFYCVTFAVMTYFSLVIWCLGGVVSGRFIRSPRVYKIINGSLGLILASSVVSLF
jgi:threonine/homoserine/homoserine lactone efflux protein